MRWSILTTTLMFLATLPATVQAQIKLPVYDESKAKTQNVSFEDASDGAYRHGNLVRITPKDDPNNPISGILVRSDAKKGLLYVRTKPGAPPRAFAASDIKRIDKGVIRTVGYSGDVDSPEIRRLEIVNGPRTTVSYSAPTLSPGELGQLRNLEAAENEVARQDFLGRLDERVRENDLVIQAAKREVASQFLAQYLARYQIGADPVVNAIDVWSLLPSHGQTVMFGWPDVPVAGGTRLSIVQTDPTIIPARAPAGTDSIDSARRSFLAAQSRGVYENGNLIAVIVPDSLVSER